MLNQQQTRKTHQVSTANICLLETLIETISPLTDVQYSWKPSGNMSSTGKHIRHIIDHYHSFFRDGDVIDYDNRSRKTIVEQRVCIARAELRSIIWLLQNSTLNSNLGRSKPMYVLISVTPDERPLPVRSSSLRELLFLQSHTIHHMAVIQMMLHTLEVSVDPDFSLAPSTRAFNTQQKRQVSL